MIRSLILGLFCAVAMAFPFAALSAWLFRFPIPFSGYETGSAAVPQAMFAVVFYGVLGGFPLLAVAGMVAGSIAHRISADDAVKRRKLILVLASLPPFLCVAVLSVLDRIIGPW